MKRLAIFTGQSLLIVLIAIFTPTLALGQAASAQPSSVPAGQNVRVVNSPNEPVPVAGTLNVGNIVATEIVLPANPLNIVSTGSLGLPTVHTFDPADTSYAVRSITVSNAGSEKATLRITGFWPATLNESCPAATTNSKPGPIVVVPAGDTVHLSFPQPIVLSALSNAAQSCFTVDTQLGITYTIVGYRF